MDPLSRREFLLTSLAASAGLAQGAQPKSKNIHEQLLDLAAKQESSRRARFAAVAAQWWGEIDRYFLDAKNGGWWQELAPDMTPATSIWSGKPACWGPIQV